jgi:PilZ domain
VTVVARFRAHARRKVRLRGVLWHPRAGWQREADVADLGLGGACVRLLETLTVGDRVTLSLVAPTLWDPLAIPGRIAWVGPVTRLEPARAGMAFEPKDAASMFALFELMGTLAYED